MALLWMLLVLSYILIAFFVPKVEESAFLPIELPLVDEEKRKVW